MRNPNRYLEYPPYIGPKNKPRALKPLYIPDAKSDALSDWFGNLISACLSISGICGTTPKIMVAPEKNKPADIK